MCCISFNFFGSRGLISTVNGIFIANFWVRPLEQLFLERFEIKKKIQMYLIKNFAEGKTFKPYYTQGEAMRIYQKLDWFISYAYSYSVKTVALTFFFMPIYPPVVFYCIFILLEEFWVQKYILINRCTKIRNYSEKSTIYLAREFFHAFIFLPVSLICLLTFL